MEDLVASTDPAEIARYKQRLEALGSPGENEPASKRKMRDMLRQQLDLAQGLADQIEEARAIGKELMRRAPSVTLRTARKQQPWSQTDRMEAYLEGLRRAGIPE